MREISSQQSHSHGGFGTKMVNNIIAKHGRRDSMVGGHHRGSSYDHGMSRLMNGVEVGEVAIVSYATGNCVREASSLDIECTFDDIFDELGYEYETVYSDDSMLVWFGVRIKSSQVLIDEVMRKARDCKQLAGLKVAIGDLSFIV